MNGFLFDTGRRQVFFETERKRKDKGTLDMILRKHWKCEPNDSLRRELNYLLDKASLEVRKTSTGVPYYKVAYKGGMMTVPKADKHFQIVTL